MALHVQYPGDFVLDPGNQKRLYPIPEAEDDSVIMYDKQIQRTSNIQSNIVECFTNWFLSFFPSNYFKFTRIRTQSAHSEFKSFMKQIYKKEKPFLVIDPRSIEHDENSIFGQNMINRYNMIDPDHDNIGAKLLYSLEIMKTDMFELVYRRNRYRFEFDVMIMEQTMDRQIDTYNMLLMNFRHNSKFLLERTIDHLLPSRHVINIANFHGYDYQSEEFLKFLNTISKFPIKKRVSPNGQVQFFMQQTLNLQVETPSLPSKDSPETSDAIEWGARVVDSFTIIADLPTEFLFLTTPVHQPKFDRGIPEDPEAITIVSPIYADMDWPTEIGEFRYIFRFDLMFDEGDDNHINLLPTIRRESTDVYKLLVDCIDHNSKLSDLMIAKVYPNGSLEEAAFWVNNQGILTIDGPKLDKLYTVLIYVNRRNLNLITEGQNKEFIGTIEKY